MKNGHHVVYAVQCRKVAETPHGKPDAKIRPMKKPWEWSHYNTFDRYLNPYHGTGNNWRPVNRKASDEWEATRRAAGVNGWWTREYAEAAMKRAQEANKRGKGDYEDPTSFRISQRSRYEFRLVEITVTYNYNLRVLESEEPTPVCPICRKEETCSL
jgi:hypothetical protein